MTYVDSYLEYPGAVDAFPPAARTRPVRAADHQRPQVLSWTPSNARGPRVVHSSPIDPAEAHATLARHIEARGRPCAARAAGEGAQGAPAGDRQPHRRAARGRRGGQATHRARGRRGASAHGAARRAPAHRRPGAGPGPPAPAGPALRHRPPGQRPRRAGPCPRARARDPLGRQHRPALRLRPLARPARADGPAHGALPRGEALARHHHRLHRVHRAQGAGLAAEPRRAGEGELRHRVHAPACEGVAVPARDRLLHRLHRVVEPVEVRAARRRGVERAAVGGGNAGRAGEVRRDVRELLVQPGVRGLQGNRRADVPLRSRRVCQSRGHAGRAAHLPRGGAVAAPARDPGEAGRRAQAPQPLEEPGGGRHRHWQDDRRRAGLQAAAQREAAGPGPAPAVRGAPAGDPEAKPWRLPPGAALWRLRRALRRRRRAGRRGSTCSAPCSPSRRWTSTGSSRTRSTW